MGMRLAYDRTLHDRTDGKRQHLQMDGKHQDIQKKKSLGAIIFKSQKKSTTKIITGTHSYISEIISSYKLNVQGYRKFSFGFKQMYVLILQ